MEQDPNCIIFFVDSKINGLSVILKEEHVVVCQGKEPGKTDFSRFCKTCGIGCGEYLLPKEQRQNRGTNGGS